MTGNFYVLKIVTSTVTGELAKTRFLE